MLDFNLEYYRTFYYVARLGNMTKAAKALYISQPAVSRSVQELERRLGATLFERKAKGMALTPEGEALFRHVSAGFEHFIEGEQELLRLLQLTTGTIRIAATETPLYRLLLPKIESFRRTHPKVHFSVSGGSSSETIALLKAGAVDFALAVSPIPPDSDLQVFEGEQFRDVFVAGSDFQLLQDRILSAEEISNYPLIAVERGTSARACIDRWFEEQGVFFVPTYSVRTTSNIFLFVERNLAIGILPSLFAESWVAAGRLFELKSEPPLHARAILVIHQNKVPLSLLCKQFLEHVLEA